MITIDAETYITRLGYEYKDNPKYILGILYLVAMELTNTEVVGKVVAWELSFLLGYEEGDMSRVWYIPRSPTKEEGDEVREVISLVTNRVRNSKSS